MIRLKNVSKSYDGGRTYAVRDVSLEVPKGKTLVLLGSSGCGKTTTLKMINRLAEPGSGAIEVNGVDVAGQDLTALRRSIGYVSQRVGLFPHMTVEENVGIGLRLAGEPESRRRARVRELLETVELAPESFAGRYPEELSGGQEQRVGVARALATEAKYLLMDEPFSALDAVTRESLQLAIKRVRAKLGITIVFVTHDLFEALELGDRIGVMHEGRLVQIGTREDLLTRPATPFVENLFQKPARLLGGDTRHG